MTTAYDQGARIEQLLDDVKAAAGPVAWPRVEALVTALVDLYGSGLERMLNHARAAALDRQELDARLVADELVGSLLALHDLHPIGIEQRIGRALEHVRAEIPDSSELALVGIENGVVTLRTDPASPGGQSSRTREAPSLQVVARAIEHAAPEVSGVRIDGVTQAPARDRGLISAESLLRGGRA